jgi:hypothetical protein
VVWNILWRFLMEDQKQILIKEIKDLTARLCFLSWSLEMMKETESENFKDCKDQIKKLDDGISRLTLELTVFGRKSKCSVIDFCKY